VRHQLNQLYVAAFTDSLLDLTALQGCRLVIISAPQTRLTSDEILCLEEYLQQGGGLLLISDSSGLPAGFDEIAHRRGKVVA
jgi:hypothetical protein